MFLPYVDIVRDLDDVIITFLGGLKSILIIEKGLIREIQNHLARICQHDFPVRVGSGGAHLPMRAQRFGGGGGSVVHVAM